MIKNYFYFDDPGYINYSFAAPCLPFHLARKEISSKKYEELLFLFRSLSFPSQEEQEKLFPQQFLALRDFSFRLNQKNYWQKSIVLEFWRSEHNRYIDGRKGSYADTSEKESFLCKTYEARVVRKLGKKIVVNFCGIEKKVNAIRIPNVKVGNLVLVHLNYAGAILE